MSTRPVVAVVTDTVHPYSFGGREIRYYELSRRMAETVDTHIYTMRWWNGPRVHTENEVTLHGISPRMNLYQGRRRSVRQALVFALACFRLLWGRYDVLQVDHIPQFQLFTMRIVATLRRKPLIATWHEVWGPEYWQSYMGGRAGRIAWWIELASMRMPDRIIAASAQTAQRLNGHLKGRTPITIAPNGIDLESVELAAPAAATTDIVVVSRLMVHKRLDMLLSAVAALHAEGRPVTCRIIGTGPERERLHEQAERLKISDSVEFLHDVREQKELYSYIKAGRVFALPSEREGFGIAVLEALACGLPVVTTSAPDNLARHLVARSRHGLICDHSVEALALSIGTVLSADSGPHAAEAWLSDYSWESIARLIMREIEA